jgi:hypothetical protein
MRTVVLGPYQGSPRAGHPRQPCCYPDMVQVDWSRQYGKQAILYQSYLVLPALVGDLHRLTLVIATLLSLDRVAP